MADRTQRRTLPLRGDRAGIAGDQSPEGGGAVQRIEAVERDAIPHIERVLVQVEPVGSPHVRYAVPLAADDGPVSAHFGEAPYFAILTLQRDDRSVL